MNINILETFTKGTYELRTQWFIWENGKGNNWKSQPECWNIKYLPGHLIQAQRLNELSN